MRMSSSPSMATSSTPPLPSPPTSTSSLLTYSNGSSPSSTTQISPRRSRLPSTTSTAKIMTYSATAEDDALDQIAKEAESRLAARRAARAEAREIRLREMERQQKEMEETSDRHYELLNNNNSGGGGGSGSGSSGYESYHGLARIASINSTARNTPTIRGDRESRTGSYTSSRRSSQDSLDFAGGGNIADTARELRYQRNELDEKYRSAMIINAQLDNEKQTYVYQLDLYKDELEELEEFNIRLTRDHKEKSKNYDQIKRDYDRLRADFEMYKAALEERDRLIIDAGLVLIRNESDQKIRLCSQSVLSNGSALVNGEGKLVNGNLQDVDDLLEPTEETPEEPEQLQLSNNISLISKQAAALLSEIPGDTLEKKLTVILSQNKSLQATVKEVSTELEEERARFNELNDSMASRSHHLTSEMEAEIQREANKITNDLRYKLKKAEQEITALTATVSRLDAQVARYKTISEESEREADEQKSEKRKAQRELREAQTRIEELESANNHLQKRIDKLKSGRILLPSTPSSVPTTPVPSAAPAGSTAPFPAAAQNGNTSTTSTSSSEDPSNCSSEASSTIASND